jgi:hypothetical protein
MDFGRMPAALFAQQINGRVYVQHELQGYNEGATTFAPKVKRILEKNYPGCRLVAHGDPKGQDKGQANEQTAFEVFAAHGIPVNPAPCPTNDIKERVEAVSHGLNDNPGGVNRWVISPRCRTLIVGLMRSSTARWRRVKGGGCVTSRPRAPQNRCRPAAAAVARQGAWHDAGH